MTTVDLIFEFYLFHLITLNYVITRTSNVCLGDGMVVTGSGNTFKVAQKSSNMLPMNRYLPGSGGRNGA